MNERGVYRSTTTYGHEGFHLHLAHYAAGPGPNGGPSTDGHYMAILQDYRSEPAGYPSLRRAVDRIEQETDTDEANIMLNDLCHKHFGYHDIQLDKISIVGGKDNDCNSVQEGQLFAEVMITLVDKMTRKLELLPMWIQKLADVGVTAQEPSASTGGNLERRENEDEVDSSPLYQAADATSAHTWESYLTAFTKNSGKGTRINWWDASFGQIQWVHSTAGIKRIAFERLFRPLNIFPHSVEVDGTIIKIGNRNRPVTTHMAHRQRSGDNTDYLFILAIHVTKTANPRLQNDDVCEYQCQCIRCIVVL